MTSYSFVYRNVVLVSTADFDAATLDWRAEAVFRSPSGQLVICQTPRHAKSAAEALEWAQAVATKAIDVQMGDRRQTPRA